MEPLPHSIEAERGFLGSILLDGRLIDEAVELLRPDDFYTRSHGRIYRAMIALHERHASIDPVLIAAELDGDLQSVGGMTALTKLIEGLPAVSTIAPYAGIVREKALARRAQVSRQHPCTIR